MTTLVTGGTGFLGSAVVRALLAKGEAVRALSRPGSDRSNLADLDVEIVEGDLTEPATLVRASTGIRRLYHVAADYRLWVRDPRVLYEANVAGTKNLLRAAAEAGVSRIVYTSSVAALGIDPSGAPADERYPVRESDMIGPYKHSKYLAEHSVLGLAEEGVPVVIVNPSTPIGPRDIKPTPTGRMILEAARGRMPAYVDTGLNVAHVDDVAAGHLMAEARGVIGERYILGGDNLALREILHTVAGHLGKKPPQVRLPHQLVLPIAALAEGWYRLLPPRTEPMLTLDSVRMSAKRMYFSSNKAQQHLGYQSRPAAQAIQDAVDWFKVRGLLT